MMTRYQWFRTVDTHARMALRADATRLTLGYLWWVLEPIFFVAVFYLVFGVILQSGRADFLTFLIVGKLPFQWFAGAVNHSAGSIVAAQPIISQLPMNKSFFPLSKVQESSYKQLAVFALLMLYLIYDGAPMGWHWFWLFPIAFCQYLLIAAVSMASAAIVCVARDFAKIVQLATMALMFGSGIFWDVRDLPQTTQDLVLTWNPVAYLLDAYRQVLLYDEHFDPAGLVIWSGTSIAVVYSVNRLFRAFSSQLTLRVMR
jgi:lipopolysaccharide transport system permease protein